MGTITFSRRSTVDADAVDVSEICWSGRILGPDVEAIHAVIEAGLLATPGCSFIVGDTTAVMGADATARLAASRLMQMLRARGIERVIAIAPSPIIRLLCSTIAVISGTPLDLVETRDDAERRLVVLRAQLRSRRRPLAAAMP